MRAHVISRRSTTGPRFRRVRAGMGTFECTRHVPSSPGPSPLNTNDCCSMVIVVGSAGGPRRCCQRRVMVGASACKSQKSQLWALRDHADQVVHACNNFVPGKEHPRHQVSVIRRFAGWSYPAWHPREKRGVAIVHSKCPQSSAIYVRTIGICPIKNLSNYGKNRYDRLIVGS